MKTSNLTTKPQPSLNELTNITVIEKRRKNEKTKKCVKFVNFWSNFIERDNFVAEKTCIFCSKQSFKLALNSCFFYKKLQKHQNRQKTFIFVYNNLLDNIKSQEERAFKKKHVNKIMARLANNFLHLQFSLSFKRRYEQKHHSLFSVLRILSPK